MAKIEEMLSVIKDLTSDVTIPGLDVDTVVPAMVEARFKNELGMIEDAKQKEAETKKMIEYYKTQGRVEVETQIATIKMGYKTVKSQVVQITAAAKTAVASNLIPPVISVPPAVPNPAYVLVENATKVSNFISMIEGALAKFGEMLLAAVKIAFEIPDMVMNLLKTLLDLKKTVTAIPVPA